MAEPEFKEHALLKQLYEKYNLSKDFTGFIELYLSQIYGQLLFSFAVGLVADDALNDLDAMLADPSMTQEEKTFMLLKLVKDHSDVDLDEFYTHVVKLFIYHLEKNIATVIKLYNKSIQESKTRKEVEEKFLEYLSTLNDMKVRNLKDSLNLPKDNNE